MRPDRVFALPAGPAWVRAGLIGLALVLAGLAGVGAWGAAHPQDVRPVPALTAPVIAQTATPHEANPRPLETPPRPLQPQAAPHTT